MKQYEPWRSKEEELEQQINHLKKLIILLAIALIVSLEINFFQFFGI
jgi:hypothetical protein